MPGVKDNSSGWETAKAVNENWTASHGQEGGKGKE